MMDEEDCEPLTEEEKLDLTVAPGSEEDRDLVEYMKRKWFETHKK